MTNGGLGPLGDGTTVAVIGGGPGGTATAIALRREAQALGRIVRVIVVEGKQFSGEQQYNQCVGVLSPPIVDLFQKELEVPFPHLLGQKVIVGYVLHTPHQQIVLDGEGDTSIALRRIQFDAYMLDAIRERGVEVLHARVTGLEFHTDRVIIYTEKGPLEVDVVVGAFGMDEGTGVLFADAVGYQPPPALSSVVTKYHPGEASMTKFGNRIHAFLPTLPRIEFGAITPKRNHLTVNIAGATVDANLMDIFLRLPEVQSALPGIEVILSSLSTTEYLRYFKGRFPCGLARNFMGDRFVMVGDAAGLVRAFKGKGVTSAIQTGVRAAHTILHVGISGRAFRAYRTANADILDDLPYGQAMRHLSILASHLGIMDFIVQVAKTEPGLRQALFDAVSAHRSYQEVVRQGLTRSSIRAMLVALVRGNSLRRIV